MSTTVVVARTFRNTRLYLTSSKPREFTWSANRQLAMAVSISVALRIMTECEDFEHGTDAFAIDQHDCVIAHASNGSVRMLRSGGYRDEPTTLEPVSRTELRQLNRDRCPDCGAPGETVGHQTCQYPGRVSDRGQS